MESIPADLVQTGGEVIHPDLDLQQDLEDRRMADHMDSIPSHHTPKERQLAVVAELQNRISHPSKVMLKIILNRLQPQAEDIITEESKPVAEREGALKNKYSISGSSARNTYSISRISTMSS